MLEFQTPQLKCYSETSPSPVSSRRSHTIDQLFSHTKTVLNCYPTTPWVSVLPWRDSKLLKIKDLQLLVFTLPRHQAATLQESSEDIPAA